MCVKYTSEIQNEIKLGFYHKKFIFLSFLHQTSSKMDDKYIDKHLLNDNFHISKST